MDGNHTASVVPNESSPLLRFQVLTPHKERLVISGCDKEQARSGIVRF
jgi:hypothetical protein